MPKRDNQWLSTSTGVVKGVTGIVVSVLRAVKMFLTPGWIALHLFVWTAAVVMVQLGRWQLRVSNSKHFDLQNFGYAFQWWAFSTFAVLLWLRMLRDARRDAVSPPAAVGSQLAVRPAQAGPADLVALPAEPGQAPVTYRGYLMPQSAANPVRGGDSVQASYNDYLWELALADAAGQAGRAGRADAGRADSGQPAAHPTEARVIDGRVIDEVDGAVS
jgi:DNA-binding transcriptional regulator of glucitol operon